MAMINSENRFPFRIKLPRLITINSIVARAKNDRAFIFDHNCSIKKVPPKEATFLAVQWLIVEVCLGRRLMVS